MVSSIWWNRILVENNIFSYFSPTSLYEIKDCDISFHYSAHLAHYTPVFSWTPTLGRALDQLVSGPDAPLPPQPALPGHEVPA